VTQKGSTRRSGKPAQVVFLERDGIWLLARFAEVRAALRDPERFCSATGSGSVGLVRIRVR
jgi:cytochrome P450